MATMSLERKRFIAALKALDVPEGAYVLIWTKGFVSKIITYLQQKWLGVKDAPTHIERAIDSKKDISAEPKGMMQVDRVEELKNVRRAVIWVRKEFDSQRTREKFREAWKSIEGTKYDFFFYVLVILRIFTFFIPAALLYTGIISKFWILVTVIILVVIYFPIKLWLKGKAKKTWACSESSNFMDRKCSIKTGIEIDHNSSPLHYWRMAQAYPKVNKTIFDSGWIK